MVLLKNDGNLLPLGPNVRSIVVIGSHADKGVLAGSGSSLVYPNGGNAVPGLQPTGWPGPVMYYPSSPLEAIRRSRRTPRVTFVDGNDPAAAAAAAKAADVAIVFANQWTSESIDAPLTLTGNQDALIEAVAAANPRTAVVLETGGPVSDAVGSARAGDPRSLVSGHERRQGDRQRAVRPGQPVGPPAGHLPREREPAAATGPAGHGPCRQADVLD